MNPAPAPWKVWFIATRPKTLGAALAPVLMGSALAAGEGSFHLAAALATLGAALLIQIGTNLANDVLDYTRGSDREDRRGPTRVTQVGWVTPTAMHRATALTFALSVPLGLYLVYRGGIPILIIGLSAFLFGILYTGGPKPLGYLGLGDVLVLIYFGPVAVGGTYYVQALKLDPLVLLAGLAPGFLATALLTVNNLRDRESDAHSGKNTLAVRFGRRFAQAEYLSAMVIPALIPVYLAFREARPGALLATLSLLLAVPAVRLVLKNGGPVSLIRALEITGRVLLVYGVAFSLGWLV